MRPLHLYHALLSWLEPRDVIDCSAIAAPMTFPFSIERAFDENVFQMTVGKILPLAFAYTEPDGVFMNGVFVVVFM